MSTYTHHPKRVKNCVFCLYWTGEAILEFVNASVGYKYDSSAKGKCTRGAGTRTTIASFSCGRDYAPNEAARKLL